MTTPLNPEKSRQLRPLRIVLAILIAVLVVLVLDRLPTSVKDREIAQKQSQNQTDGSAVGSSAKTDVEYYYLNGFLGILESQTEQRLIELGVPEEDYTNAAEYFTKDEIYELEVKTALAATLEETYVEATPEGIADLKKIFNLGDDFSFDQFQKLEGSPAEYKTLSELLATYHKTIDTTEDYDTPAK